VLAILHSPLNPHGATPSASLEHLHGALEGGRILLL
jgi:hypothetical protein